jgi:peroxiredoxin
MVSGVEPPDLRGRAAQQSPARSSAAGGGRPMKFLLRYRLLIAGLLSPFAALFLYTIVYSFLTRRSADTEKDWLLRLSLSTAAMALPGLIILIAGIIDWRRRMLNMPGKIGLALAILSLGLVAGPVRDGTKRWKQTRNAAMSHVPAPLFATPDINGNMERLADHKGQVVIVNIWATWCGPCRLEMPRFDKLYRERAGDGLMIFGISDEPVETQKKFLERVPVTYPLLTLSGDVPSLYRDIARYPAVFLIDREGRLVPAPPPEEQEQLFAMIDSLLNAKSQSSQ